MLAEEMSALNRTAPFDLRANLLKAKDRDEAHAALKAEGIEAEPTTLSPLGLRLGARKPIEHWTAFRSGMVEVQDEGSQIVAALVDAKPGMKVVDLGAAPGGWTQVAVERVRAGTPKGGLVVGIDINAWDKVTGATCITMDFMDNGAPDVLKKALGGKSDVVLSDMASPATGHPGTDHIRIMALAELAWAFAEEVLAPGGTFICKVFQGGTEGDLLKQIKNCFSVVKHAKPPASRKDSAEVYLAAMGFKA